ncbi:MAG: hypothetical protein OXT74_19150 [Candidatus Poribacteria bacterium]|nr:hypothetical protein [Candidatus Poribacteria bacterium]
MEAIIIVVGGIVAVIVFVRIWREICDTHGDPLVESGRKLIAADLRRRDEMLWEADELIQKFLSACADVRSSSNPDDYLESLAAGVQSAEQTRYRRRTGADGFGGSDLYMWRARAIVDGVAAAHQLGEPLRCEDVVACAVIEQLDKWYVLTYNGAHNKAVRVYLARRLGGEVSARYKSKEQRRFG